MFLFYDVFIFYEFISLRLSVCIFNVFHKILHGVKYTIKFSERIFSLNIRGNKFEEKLKTSTPDNETVSYFKIMKTLTE